MAICLPVPECNTQACQYHKLMSVYVGIPLFVFGLLSNILCVILWKKLMAKARRRNVTCGIYLTTIAIVDTGMLMSFFLVDSLSLAIKDITSYHAYNVFFAYIGFPAFMFFTFLSFWLIAGVDTCRFTMIIFPIKMRQSATKITNTAIFTIIFYCLGVNVPNFFAFVPVQANNTACLHETDLYKTQSFFNYRFWFQCVFLTVFPWSVIVLVNLLMIIRSYYVCDLVPKWQKRGKEMDYLLHSISLWFAIIISWQCVAQCFYLKTPHTNSEWSEINQSFAFAKMGMVLNSSTKVILYILASKTFRRAFIHLVTNTKSTYKNTLSKTFSAKQLSTGNTPHGKSINAVSPIMINNLPSKRVEISSVFTGKLFSIHDVPSVSISIK